MSDTNEQKTKYKSLAPICDISKSEYFEALSFAISKSDVLNIAVTGSYGSGKSSILRSFVDKRKENKYLQVSLANFSEKKPDEIDARKVEELILQQIFYQLPSKAVPFSSFKRINFFSKKIHTWLIILFIVWLFSVSLLPHCYSLILGNLKSISNYGLIEFLKHIDWLSSIINFVILGYFSFGLFFFTNEVYRLSYKGKLKKITVNSAELELNSESALNKHIDELIYFFEATEYNVVIIEDLDRFENIGLFSKLREVNNLINNSPKISQKVKFIYAIKDDVFRESLMRTKFFDFILPIVPVINTTNSGEKLKKYLGKDELPDSLISDISLFIHDMRLLKNIVNEYNIFKEVISKSKSKEKIHLFSMVLYKNLFPDKYITDHTGNGFLYNIFNEIKSSIYHSLTQESQNKINKLNQEIANAESEKQTGYIDLRKEYIAEILESYENIYALNDISLNEFIKDDERFGSLYKNPGIYTINNRNSYNRKNIDFEEIQNTVNSKYTYKERKILVERKHSSFLMEAEEEIKELEEKKSNLKNKKLSGLIKVIGNNSWKSFVFQEEKLNQNQNLFLLLIRNGYINENYQLYISYFYPGSLNQQDFDFLTQVKTNEGDNFNKELTNYKELVKRISYDEFEFKACINKALIKYMIQYPRTVDIGKLKVLLNQFINIKGSLVNYIIPIIESIKNDFVRLSWFLELMINDFYPSIWNAIENSELTNEAKDKLLMKFINLEAESLFKLNYNTGNNGLKSYLENKTDFIEIFSQQNTSDVIKLLATLKLKFTNIEFRKHENNKLADFIFENNHYEFNNEMLRLVLYNCTDLSIDEFDKKYLNQNYTFLADVGSQQIKDYISESFAEYIDSIYLNLPYQQTESQENFADFFERYEDDDLNYLKRILKKNDTKVDDIVKFGFKEIWHLLFEFNNVKPTWDNAYQFYYNCNENKDENFDILIKWLNQSNVFTEISKTKVQSNNFDKNTGVSIGAFFQLLIENDSINNDTYEVLINSITYIFYKIDLQEISKEKRRILIECKKITLSSEHYDFFNQNSEFELLFKLIKQNFKEYLPTVTQWDFSEELLLMLLDDKTIPLIERKVLINHTAKDLLTPKLANAIAKVLIRSRTLFVVTEKLVEVLVVSDDKMLKMKLFYKYLNKLKFPDINRVLTSLGGEFSKATELMKRPKWEYDKLSYSISQKLLKRRYFSTAEREDDKIRIVVRYM